MSHFYSYRSPFLLTCTKVLIKIMQIKKKKNDYKTTYMFSYLLTRHCVATANKTASKHRKESLERNLNDVRPPVRSSITLLRCYLTTYSAFLWVLTAACKSSIHNTYIWALHFNVILENVIFFSAYRCVKGTWNSSNGC